MTRVSLAGCVILDDYSRILLLHRSADDYSQWELPGGKLEEDETAEQAAVREVQEELGIDVRLTGSLGSCEFEHNGQQYHYAWFQANINKGEPRVCEPETFDDLEYFEVADLMSLALSTNMQELFAKLITGEVALNE